MSNGHIDISTQEVGTGRWVTVMSLYPNSPEQRERAEELRDSLRHLGLFAEITEVAE